MCGPTQSLVPLNSTTDREPLYQWSGTPIIKDSVIKSTGRFNASYQVTNSRIMITGECGDPDNGKGTSFVDNGFWNNYTTSLYSQSEASFKNFIFQETANNFVASLDAYYAGVSSKVLHFIDTGWIDTTYVARVRGNNTNLPDIMMFDDNSLDVCMIDVDGTPIEDATITLTDVNGDNGIYSPVWEFYTTTALGTSGTSMTIVGDAPTIGEYYRIGFEIIQIVSGTNPFTIARAQLGSTANGIGGSSKKNYGYKLHDDATTDVNGEASFQLTNRRWISYSTTQPYVYVAYDDMDNMGPYTLTIEKVGYETIIMQYNPVEKRKMIIKMNTAIPAMVSMDGQVAVKLDPTNSNVNRGMVVIT